MRKPFQGVGNIIRFNWHFYVLSFAVVTLLLLIRNHLPEVSRTISDGLMLLMVGTTTVSLLVSCYVYDFSSLYTLSWLDPFNSHSNETIVTINAGFDETSSLLTHKFAGANLLVFDFYDPTKHTEVSIKRARKAYPPFPTTQPIKTNHLPIQDHSVDIVFAFLSAHEIRDAEERCSFFKEIVRTLRPTGQVIVTEHIRDLSNFLAYNIGFFHFYSRATWLRTFQQADLRVTCEIKITPFITTFIIEKNGATA